MTIYELIQKYGSERELFKKFFAGELPDGEIMDVNYKASPIRLAITSHQLIMERLDRIEAKLDHPMFHVEMDPKAFDEFPGNAYKPGQRIKTAAPWPPENQFPDVGIGPPDSLNEMNEK